MQNKPLTVEEYENLDSQALIEAAAYTCQECALRYELADRMLCVQVISGRPVVMCFLCLDSYTVLGEPRGLPHGWRYLSRDLRPKIALLGDKELNDLLDAFEKCCTQPLFARQRCECKACQVMRAFFRFLERVNNSVRPDVIRMVTAGMSPAFIENVYPHVDQFLEGL